MPRTRSTGLSNHAFLIVLLLLTAPMLASAQPRVIVSSDIGGEDPDDFQSMVHFLVYTDVLDVEGVLSSPPGPGRLSHIEQALDAYETDYETLRSWGPYPTPEELRAVARQGATDAGEPSADRSTDGSSLIIERARAADSRPLWILVWGSITDVAQALYDAAEEGAPIDASLRIYSIGSWNTAQDTASRDYLYENHPDLWWIESDTPSVLYMISPLVGGPGDHDDPTSASWGGAYVATDHSPPVLDRRHRPERDGGGLD